MANYGTPLRAIRAHCKECCGGEGWKEVECCACLDCVLWPWRFGKRPATARAEGKIVDPEQFKEA